MLQQPEKLDISYMVDYLGRLRRASVAGAIYEVITFSGFTVAAFYSGDRSRGVLWIVFGAVILGLLRRLQKGFLIAAVALGPAFILGMLLIWRGMMVNGERISWCKGALGILLALLAFGPIGYILLSGVKAIYTSRQSHFGEIFESLGSRPYTSIQQPNRVTHDKRDWRNWRITILQRCSEVLVLAGAGMTLANASLSMLSNFRGGLLSLIGAALLILGVNLSLHVEQVSRTRVHELLMRDNKPTVLLLRPMEDDLLKIRAKFTLSRLLANSFPNLPLTQVIQEQASRFGVVVAGDVAEMVRRRKLDGWIRTSQVIVMIAGRIDCLDRERSHTAEQFFRQGGILVFPPASFRQLKRRWESFCQQFNGAVEQSQISGPELTRAILLVFRHNERPLLILISSRDEWAYQTAFKVAADALQCKYPSVMEKGVSAL